MDVQVALVPFVKMFQRISACALLSVMALAGSMAQGMDAKTIHRPSPQELEKSIERGLAFLLKDQNKDGSWGTAQRTKDLNIFAPAPGAYQAFRCAVTALCVSALIETGAADKEPAAQSALERGEVWLLKNLPDLRRADTVAIYNVWGHAYGIHALVDMYHRSTNDERRKQEIKECILTQIDLLRRYESVDGGWGYYDFRVGSKRPASDSTSFVTATALVVFHEARQIGIEVPKDLSSRAIASLNRQRKNDLSYDYGEYLKMRPMLPINRPAGSLGRSQACNLALRLWEDKTITDTVLTKWLDRLVARAMSGSRSAANDRFPMSPGFRSPVISFTTDIITRRSASSSWTPRARSLTRGNWPVFSSRFRKRMARGGIFRSTITINNTGRPSPSCRSRAVAQPRCEPIGKDASEPRAGLFWLGVKACL